MAAIAAGPPYALLIDLPMLPGQSEAQDQFRLAVRQQPWKSQAVFVSPETTGYAARSTFDLPATLGSLASALDETVSDRIDSWTALDVDLLNGALGSASAALVLNGANAAAVQSASDAWEVIQFERAEEIAPGRWRLSRLLRGQLGTGDAMRAGAAMGAPFVLLDAAVGPVGLRANEIGLTLNWRVGAADTAFTDANFLTLTAKGGLRSRLPWSPAHLRADLTPGGDLAVTWIRRSRLGGDDWEPVEIPLDEPVETYRVEIVDVDGGLVRRASTSSPAWIYAVADRTADFGALPHLFELRVRQSGAFGDGVAEVRKIEINS